MALLWLRERGGGDCKKAATKVAWSSRFTRTDSPNPPWFALSLSPRISHPTPLYIPYLPPSFLNISIVSLLKHPWTPHPPDNHISSKKRTILRLLYQIWRLDSLATTFSSLGPTVLLTGEVVWETSLFSALLLRDLPGFMMLDLKIINPIFLKLVFFATNPLAITEIFTCTG